ncbi:TonB-dependent receptor [Sphingomonas sp. Leaf339]|nr:TonB-dependent receptor [Sphingomonas sp. Leaf339]
MLLTSAAFAQSTTGTAGTQDSVNIPNSNPAGQTPPEEGSSDPAEILVTGSRIRSPNLESVSPITVVTGAQLFETGQVSVGDVLNELPQLRPTFSQQNSTRFLGTRGLNLLDLYGLGSQRTLVLVNGRRHVGQDILLNGVSVDINTLPSDLIERADIVTGGQSSVYGSDAIAGVVNFILKDDYDGLQMRGQSGISKYGDAATQYVSLLAGKNFADGRGNIAVDLEFSHAERYFASQRPAFRQNNGFVTVDTDPAGSVNGSDGVIDRVFFNDIRSATISTGGQLGFRYANSATAPCGVDAVGNSFTCAYLFQPGGTLTPQTGLRVGLGPNGNFINGNGYSGREGQLLTFTPDLKRYSANLIGHFEISPALVPYIEAKYSRTDAFGSVSGPFFSQGTTLSDVTAITGFTDRSLVNGGAGVNREGIRVDNPFLNAQARATITQQLTAALNTNVNPNTGTSYGTTAAGVANRAATLAQIADGSYRFNLRRNYVDLGIRDEKIRRETYRIVGGLRGTFNDDWSYDISANYGEFKEKNFIQNNINRQRFLLANDTARNAAGQIVCRSQIDARYAGIDRGGNPAQLAADVAACVPLNPFGDGSISDAARQYLTVASRAEGKITQFDALGYVSGDLSQLFELPGGPISFSIGGEYRRETNFYDLDDLTQAGYAFYNAIPPLSPPTAFEVKEAFGEIRVPLLANLPLIKSLTLTGSGRVSDYKGSTGTVYTYSGGAEWQVIDDFRLRGSYSRAVRAPNLGELYSEQSQNFTPAPNDPCSARNLATGSANRVANCTAAGRPADYDFVYTSSLEILSGDNPNLREETSDSYTGGFVFTPTFLPGFSMSSDSYDITVNDVITSTGTPQQILNLCYDSASLNNAFCGLFQRAGASGGPRGEQPFRVLEGSLLQASANFAKLKVRGINTDVAYRHTFGSTTFDLSAQWTRAIQNDSFTNPADVTFRDRLLGELGNPKNRVNVNTSAKFGAVTVGYQFRFIDRMYLNTYEDYNALNGLPPQNTDYAPIEQYPTVTYHDVRLNVAVNDRFNTYIGVDNVGNKLPPYGLTGVGAGSGIYDVRGRFAYVGAVAKF